MMGDAGVMFGVSGDVCYHAARSQGQLRALLLLVRREYATSGYWLRKEAGEYSNLPGSCFQEILCPT
jgi:hypothetical protein